MAKERNIVDIISNKGKKFSCTKKETRNLINRLNSSFQNVEVDFQNSLSHHIIAKINGIVKYKKKELVVKQYEQIENTDSWFDKFFAAIESGETVLIKDWKFKQG